MSRSLKRYLIAGITVLFLLGAYGALPSAWAEEASARGVEMLMGTQLEPIDPAPEEVEAESAGAQQAPAGQVEAMDDEIPEDIPGLDERDAILDGVNLGPGDPDDSFILDPVEGPPPGTESQVGESESAGPVPMGLEADSESQADSWVGALTSWLAGLIRAWLPTLTT